MFVTFQIELQMTFQLELEWEKDILYHLKSSLSVFHAAFIWKYRILLSVLPLETSNKSDAQRNQAKTDNVASETCGYFLKSLPLSSCFCSSSFWASITRFTVCWGRRGRSPGRRGDPLHSGLLLLTGKLRAQSEASCTKSYLIASRQRSHSAQFTPIIPQWKPKNREKAKWLKLIGPSGSFSDVN